MRSLVIYAHPYSGSFNQDILRTLTTQLTASGHDLRVRDLCAQGWDPRLTAADLEASRRGTVLPDVRAEQDLVRWAETLFFIHPIWWFGMPAVLKGWIDRVFSMGFAYVIKENGVTGLLKGKTAFFINTTGGGRDEYKSMGMYAALEKTIDDGIVRLCGMRMGGRTFLHSVPTAGDAQKKAMLEEVRLAAERSSPVAAGL